MNVIFTNTYARRVTKHHAYDYEDELVIGDSLKKTELANVDHTFNMYIEKVLTKVHETSKMFVIVNMSLPGYPIVYASNEFIDFWDYERSEVFQADGRLKFMSGPKTSKRMFSEMKHSMDTALENTLDHKIYTKKEIAIDTTIGLLKLPTQDKDSFFVITFDPFQKRGDLYDGELSNKLKEIELGPKSLVAPMLKIKNEILNVAAKKKMSLRLLEDSFLRKAWDWINLIFTLWATISVPFEASFEGGFLHIEWIDVITDVVFLIDLALNFRTTYVNADGLVIGDGLKMAKHYLRGWFTIDACSSIPWQCIQLVCEWAFDSTNLGRVLRIFKLIRVLRICKVAKKLDGYTRNGPLSLALLMALFVMVGHWLACRWFWVGRLSFSATDGIVNENLNNGRHGTGWITQYFTENKYNFTGNLTGDYAESAKPYHPELYASSLYFIMTILCTVGFGNIAPYDEAEMLFCIICMILGAFMYALIFGSATNIIMRMGSQQSRFLNQLTDIENFLAVNKFPLDLRNRIEDFFYYHWYNSKGIEHSEMMTLWPKTLKEDTSLYLHRVLFGEWPVFNEANTGCRRALSSLVQRVGFGPGDYIVHKDDCITSMYFLVRGHLKIIRDGDVLGILAKGDTFGQKFWPTRVAGKSDTDILAMTYAEIEVLDHKDLKDIFVKFPDYWDLWENKLETTYELCQDDNIFNGLPEDLGTYVSNQRTPATGDVLNNQE